MNRCDVKIVNMGDYLLVVSREEGTILYGDYIIGIISPYSLLATSKIRFGIWRFGRFRE